MKTESEFPVTRQPEADLVAVPQPEPPAPEDPGTRKPPRTDWILWVLGALLILVPTIDLPDKGVWASIKPLMLEMVGILLAVYVASSGEWTWTRVRAALLAAPNLAILAFLIWVGFSAARTDVPTLYKKMSHAEAMRHFGGALIYFSVVYGLSVRRHLQTLVGFLLLAGSLGAMMAAYTYLAGVPNVIGQTHVVQGAFPDMDILAGFLQLTLVPAIVAAFAERELWRRSAAQITVVLISAIIVASGSRGVWFGVAAALLTLIALFFRYRYQGRKVAMDRQQLLYPVVMLVAVLGLGGWLIATVKPTHRLKTLARFHEDEVFKWRLGQMSKGLRIMRDNPVLGSGVGTFRIVQALYFHPDAISRSQKEILRQPHDQDNCMSSYLQVGAELGVPGLVLYVNIFIVFLFTAIRALRRMRVGYRQAILMACIAAIVGGLVMVTGNESWEFAEVSLFVWLLLGIGMAIAGVGDRGRERSEGHR